MSLMCPNCGHGYEPTVHPLTDRQHDVLAYVAEYIDRLGYAPAIWEIADYCRLRSLSSVHEHLTNLQRKGWISRRYNESRSIEVLVRPLPAPVPTPDGAA